jgi:hypothetical protein
MPAPRKPVTEPGRARSQGEEEEKRNEQDGVLLRVKEL